MWCPTKWSTTAYWCSKTLKMPFQKWEGLKKWKVWSPWKKESSHQTIVVACSWQHDSTILWPTPALGNPCLWLTYNHYESDHDVIFSHFPKWSVEYWSLGVGCFNVIIRERFWGRRTVGSVGVLLASSAKRFRGAEASLLDECRCALCPPNGRWKHANA